MDSMSRIDTVYAISYLYDGVSGFALGCKLCGESYTSSAVWNQYNSCGIEKYINLLAGHVAITE